MKYELKYDKQPIKMMDLFLARGISLENLHRFCKPQRDTNYLEPTLLDNMDKGVNMLKHHIESLHKIDLIVD